MSRRDWSSLRLVAENIGAGDRDYWNLLKIPELRFGQAREAIHDLVQAGIVSVTEGLVAPTATFGDWLADLRWREDMPRSCESDRQLTAPQKGLSQREAATPADDYRRDARPKSRRLNLPVDGAGGIQPHAGARPDKTVLSVHILERLAGRRLDHADVGRPVPGEMPMAQLRQCLNAYRLPEWEAAIKLCKWLGAISIDVDDLVRLVTVPARLFPPPPRAKRKSAGRHRTARDKAARQAWVEKKRRERGEGPDEDEPRDEIKEWIATLHTP
jgi:hypothetical protein